MRHRFSSPAEAYAAKEQETTVEALLFTVQVESVVDSRAAAAVARRAGLAIGLGALHAGSVAIAASELATNIARHARQGVIRIYAGRWYLKIIAEDQGPGFTNIEAALADGHSGGRQLSSDDRLHEGLGCGLGAVRRLMDQLEILSAPGAGTRVVAVKNCPGEAW